MVQEDDNASVQTSLLSFPSSYSLSPADTMTMLSPSEAPPPYSLVDNHLTPQWPSYNHDNSSTSSISPPSLGSQARRGKRRLLLIYIHGFMGNETSFQHFPAHVHNLVTSLVRDSHVVHTKLYPRYRSKKHIQFATLDFSTWLEPHESADTDVVLIGHSLGGILAAEVAILPGNNPLQPLKHRLLGTLSFDTPFLGMHHGVVKSGLGSLFRPAPGSSKSPPSEASISPGQGDASNNTSGPSAWVSLANTLMNSFPVDPNYDRPFANDVRLPVRSGWANALHFVNKHSDDLRHATKTLIQSHLEFGGCLADSKGLKERYRRIRLLEEEESRVRRNAVDDGRSPPRVRFANYYTVSTGYPKKPKTPHAGTTPGATAPLTPSISNPSLSEKRDTQNSVIPKSGYFSPSHDDAQPDAEVLFDQDEVSRTGEDDLSSESDSTFDLRELDPAPEEDSESSSTDHVMTPASSEPSAVARSTTFTSNSTVATLTPSVTISSSGSSIAPVALPQPPQPPNLEGLGKEEYKRALKRYDQAMRAYRHTLKTFRKAEEERLKTETKLAKSTAKHAKADLKQAAKDCKHSRCGSSGCSEQGSTMIAAARSLDETEQQETSPNSILDPTTIQDQHGQNISSAELKAAKAYAKSAKDAEKAHRKAKEAHNKAMEQLEKTLRQAEAVVTEADGVESLPSPPPPSTAHEALTQALRSAEEERTKASEQRSAALHNAQQDLTKASSRRDEALRKAEQELTRAESQRTAALQKAGEERDKALRKASEGREKALRKASEEQEKALRKAGETREKALKKAKEEQERALKRAEKMKAREPAATTMMMTPVGSNQPSRTPGEQDPDIPSLSSSTTNPTQTQTQTTKPPKERKFCNLPPKDSNGSRDPCWVQVYMENMDEVAAHCSLFFPLGPGEVGKDVEGGGSGRSAGGDGIGEGGTGGGPWGRRYAWFVEDVCGRIQGWVEEAGLGDGEGAGAGAGASAGSSQPR